MFTWKESKIPFAIVKDGKLDGRILYYSDDNNQKYNYESSDDEPEDEVEDDKHEKSESEEEYFEDEEGNICDEDGNIIKKKKKVVKKKVVKKKTNLKKRVEKKKFKVSESFNHIVLDYPSHFLYVPPGNRRMSYYIGGPNGSGKSFLISQIVKMTKEIHPDFEFYLFSLKTEDKVLDKRDPMRVLLDDTLVNDPIEPSLIKNSIAVFDDIDSISDKEIKKCIYDIRKNILNVGRSMNVHCCCSNHMLCNNNETRTMLNECNVVAFFPKSTPVLHCQNYLKNYLGCSKGMMDYILGLGSDTVQNESIVKKGSRWIMTFKDSPQHVLTENECFSMSYMASIVDTVKEKRGRKISRIKKD